MNKESKEETINGKLSFNREDERYSDSSYEDSSDVDMRENISEKVQKFLDKGFQQGNPITDHQIRLIIERLGRTVDMFSVDLLEPAYRKFLNTYGAIYGKGFIIWGPTKSLIDDEEKIYDMAGVQLGFEDSCIINQMREEKAKSCWLIATVDDQKKYYINLSQEHNKNYIYCMNRDGRSEIFATDFLDFLDKFFEYYHRRDQEDDYRQKNYK